MPCGFQDGTLVVVTYFFMNRFFLLVITGFFAVGILLLPFVTTAQQATLSFSPASKTLNVGEEVAASILVNSGSVNINAVAAYISYPTAFLQVISVDATSSVLSFVAEKKAEGGVIKISGGTPTPGFSGSKQIGTVRFKAISAGTATLSLLGTSAVLTDQGNSNILQNSLGTIATYVVASQSVTPPPVPQEQKKPDSPIEPSIPSVPPQKFGIYNLRVEGIGAESVGIRWETPSPSTTTVQYGPGEPFPLMFFDYAPSVDHSIVLRNLLPESNYKFRIQSTRGTETVESDTQEFRTKGTRELTVRVYAGGFLGSTPLGGAQVTVSGETGASDEHGVVTFSGIALGEQEILVQTGETEFRKSIVIDEEENSEEVQIGGISKLAMVGIGIGVLAFLGLIFVLLFGRKRVAPAWLRVRGETTP